MSKFHAIYGKGGISPEPGGGNYGEVQTLLWTNPSPTRNFSAQTVKLDLSNYEGVIVDFYTNASESPQRILSRIKVPKNTTNEMGGGYVSSSGVARNITTVTDSGVGFSTGYTTTSDDSVMIPAKIYGYKRYQSDNLSMDANEIEVIAGADKQLDAKSYYMIFGISMAKDLSLSKGTLIGSIKQTNNSTHNVAAIVYTGNDGIINSTTNSLRVKKIEVG